MQAFDLLQGDYDEPIANGSSTEIIDTAFRKIKKNFTAFQIWRIENMTVTALPKDQYGTFYDGDAYIIYSASLYGQPGGMDTVTREVRGGLERHVHFWLGASASPDKSGVAAYKTVELDNYLGGGATQHRETQGNESPRFKSYFKSGIRVLKGGTESGFRQVSEQFEPKLYKVKGKRMPILTQLEKIDWKYFNSGDVFIIHTEKVIFVWVGRAANAVEKIHSTKAAMQLKIEHNTPNVVFIDDGYEKTLHEEEKLELNKYLPLDKRMVLPAEEGGDDADEEKAHRELIKLYRCSDNGGKYRVSELKTGPINQTDLDSDDVFILDHGTNGIWVWVGKRASEKERTEAIRNARGFVKKKKYPNKTNVTRVIDGAEPLEFKMLFTHWKDKDETKGYGKTHTVGRIAKVSVTKFDATILHDRPFLAAESQLLDDGSGVLRIWGVRKTELVEIPKERHGIFFDRDCYVVWYNYSTTSGQKYIIYYWLGLHASQDEKGIAALKTIEKDNELGGVAVQGRVVQGHEPAHLLQIFKGKLIIFKGRGTDYDETGRNLKEPPYYLLHVIGSATFNTKATQVQCEAPSLNSNHCFVLKRMKESYIWCGNNSTGDQREMAKRFAGKDFELILEGKEPEEFWASLGGRGSYTTVKLWSNDGDPKPARLFQCSTATGKFRAEEIFNFVQTDLVPEDVMLLDAHDTIFIWLGDLSTKEEKSLSLQTAKEYLETDPSGRDLNTPVICVKQGNEPPTFTGFFGVWDKTLWKKHKSFEKLRMELEGSNMSLPKKELNGTQKVVRVSDFDQYPKYPVSMLQKENDKLPPKINPLHKELHLTHDDFVSIFNMKYTEFETLPKWKQQELKKRVRLF